MNFFRIGLYNKANSFFFWNLSISFCFLFLAFSSSIDHTLINLTLIRRLLNNFLLMHKFKVLHNLFNILSYFCKSLLFKHIYNLISCLKNLLDIGSPDGMHSFIKRLVDEFSEIFNIHFHHVFIQFIYK